MIEHALTALLKSIQAKTYPRAAPKSAVAPFIVYTRVRTARVRHLTGPSGMAMPVFQIDIYDESYSAAHQTANQVRLLLDGYSDGDILHCSVIEEQDMSDLTSNPDLSRVQMEVLVTHAEEVANRG